MAESTTNSIEHQLSQLNLNQQSSTSSLEIPATTTLLLLPQHPTWRQTVTPELRIHVADKLLEALDSSRIDQQRQQFVEYAEKFENHAFETANYKAEYYHMISLKIYEIQKERYTGEQSWRESVAVELRKHIVNKLIQTIIPGCDLETVDEQSSMRNLIEYAQKVECEMFETATSRSGYYKLIGEKIYNIQEGVDEQRLDGCFE